MASVTLPPFSPDQRRTIGPSGGSKPIAARIIREREAHRAGTDMDEFGEEVEPEEKKERDADVPPFTDRTPEPVAGD